MFCEFDDVTHISGTKSAQNSDFLQKVPICAGSFITFEQVERFIKISLVWFQFDFGRIQINILKCWSNSTPFITMILVNSSDFNYFT